ncbi:MAG: glycoside-pentoside-hexuronide (GPH):cation symporter [Propionibacteriaceae bacterium]|nr:glycoside-pentoside-hexuronide (GPH):cation symporter [Propionibacteriaceae bacterium]
MKNTVRTKLSYACGDIYGGGAFMVFSLLFMSFLVLVEGIPVVAATVIIFIGRVWDAIFDPFMGRISDRTRSRFGRRRVFFLIGLVPVFLSFVMLFYGFGLDGHNNPVGSVIYFAFAYIFWGMSFSLVMVPYNAILSDMTSDYNERTSFTTIRMLFSGGASLICAVVPSLIIKAMGGDTISPNQRTGYLVMGVIFGLVFAAAWVLVFLGTYERSDLPATTDKITIKKWLSVFQNKAYRNFLGTFLAFQITVDLTLAMFIFYMDIVVKKYSYYEVVVGMLLVFTLVFTPFMNMVAQKYGKAYPLYIGLPLWMVAAICFIWMNDSTPIAVLCVVAVVIAAGSSAGNLSNWSTLSDMFDIDELRTGERREGIYSGVSTFLRKFASGVAVLLVGFGLQAFGFDQNQYNVDRSDPNFSATWSSATVLGIKWMFVLIPFILLAVALVFALRNKINKHRFDVVLKGIDEFKAHGNIDALAPDEVQDILVATGATKDELWGGHAVKQR